MLEFWKSRNVLKKDWCFILPKKVISINNCPLVTSGALTRVTRTMGLVTKHYYIDFSIFPPSIRFSGDLLKLTTQRPTKEEMIWKNNKPNAREDNLQLNIVCIYLKLL